MLTTTGTVWNLTFLKKNEIINFIVIKLIKYNSLLRR